MKNIDLTLRGLSLIALLAVGFGLSGCKSADRSMAEQWGDRQVARGVKKELSRDPMYRYKDVVPVVRDGVVQLTGFVDTPEQRQRAAELAAQTKGAVQIINTIELKPTPTGLPQGRTTNASAPPATEPAPAPVPGTPAPIHDPQANP